MVLTVSGRAPAKTQQLKNHPMQCTGGGGGRYYSHEDCPTFQGSLRLAVVSLVCWHVHCQKCWLQQLVNIGRLYLDSRASTEPSRRLMFYNLWEGRVIRYGQIGQHRFLKLLVPYDYDFCVGGLLCDCKTSIFAKVCLKLYWTHHHIYCISVTRPRRRAAASAGSWPDLRTCAEFTCDGLLSSAGHPVSWILYFLLIEACRSCEFSSGYKIIPIVYLDI